MKTKDETFKENFVAGVIALNAHKGQTRRDGRTPYYEHVLRVATKVYSKTNDKALTAVAFLHDTLEDTTVTAAFLLEHGITPDIVSMVKDLTRSEGEDYNEYLKRIREDKNLRLIKFYDKQIVKYVKALKFLFLEKHEGC